MKAVTVASDAWVEADTGLDIRQSSAEGSQMVIVRFGASGTGDLCLHIASKVEALALAQRLAEFVTTGLRYQGPLIDPLMQGVDANPS